MIILKGMLSVKLFFILLHVTRHLSREIKACDFVKKENWGIKILSPKTPNPLKLPEDKK